jgi:hypothetical protein
MALGFKATVRNSRANVIRDAIDAGSAAGKLRIYSGTRPATDGTATTLLAELTFSDPSAPNASNGVLTMSAITADTSADAATTTTATWFRVVDSNGATVMDGDCGTSGSDLNLNSTSISPGQQVSCSSFVITEGNA